jgi:hypothetical protein
VKIKIPALLRRIRWQRQPEEYPCLLTDEDTSALVTLAGRIQGVSDETQLRLPSGIVVRAAEAKGWIAENTERCTCPDCEAGEVMGDAAAEMGLALLNRRLAHESVADTTLAEQMLFGYIMSFAVDGSELDFAHRVAAEYQASVDAGDTDGKD